MTTLCKLVRLRFLLLMMGAWNVLAQDPYEILSTAYVRSNGMPESVFSRSR